MKLLYCQDCQDVVAPLPLGSPPRRCQCGRHAIWLFEPTGRYVWVNDAHGQDGHPSGEPRAWVISIQNGILTHPGDHDAASIKSITESITPEDHPMRLWGTAVCRWRPGEPSGFNATAWGPLPS